MRYVVWSMWNEAISMEYGVRGTGYGVCGMRCGDSECTCIHVKRVRQGSTIIHVHVHPKQTCTSSKRNTGTVLDRT